MDYKLLITNEAKCDIDEIISYIVNELKNPIAAENLLTKIELSFDTISSNPLAFPLCSDKRLRDGGYRKISVKNYIVFYTYFCFYHRHQPLLQHLGTLQHW